MIRSRTILLLIALPIFGCSGSPPPNDPPPESKPQPVALSHSKPRIDDLDRNTAQKLGAATGRKFALLVGVTKYDTLKVNELVGPGNDVKLMSQTLKDRFGFSDKDIVILADVAGASGRPTRANIKSQFDRLTKEAQAGDQMVILFGGHGEQQPDQEPFDEPDGLDQIFLPCDAGEYDAKTKTVFNAIVDDEIDVWTKAITDKGASLWLIVDACHSGTMLRGGTDEIARELPEGTLVPAAALQDARKGAAGRKETTRGTKTPEVKKANTGKRMALYACQRDQTAPELTAPPGGKSRHGLLSYTICQVLSEAKTKLTYGELTQRIQAKYNSEWFRHSPVPLMEGLERDTEILGAQSWTGRSQFIVAKNEEGWKVRAGQLHGLTDKSILAVYPQAGAAGADKIVGHARAQNCSPTEAELVPCAFANMPAPKTLPEGGRCELVYADHGAMRLRVAIEGAGKMEGDRQRRARQMLQEIIKASDSLIELVEPGRPADVTVRADDTKLTIFATDVAQRTSEAPPGATFGPYLADQTAKLQQDLQAIARACNLLKVVARGTNDSAADLEVEMLKFKDRKDKVGEKVVAGPKGIVLQPGELVGWRVTNNGRSRLTLDVTLLFMNSQYGIQPLFPRKGEGGSGINRFRPESPSFLVGPFPVDAKTVGLEHVIVIAVKAEGQPIDFTCLAQATLDQAREVTRGQPGQALETPLGRLMKGALYGQGTTRDLGAPVEPDGQVFRLMSWSVPQSAKK